MKANLKQIKIVDNYLPDRTYAGFKRALIDCQEQGYWRYLPGQAEVGDGPGMYVAGIYHDHEVFTKKQFGMINQVLGERLIFPCWYRLKLNACGLEKENRLKGWHTDAVYEVVDPDNTGIDMNDMYVKRDYRYMKTGIFYFSDTDGPTVFKAFPNFEVECKQNRLLIFPSNYIHSNFSHTEGPARRCVLNMNWF